MPFLDSVLVILQQILSKTQNSNFGKLYRSKLASLMWEFDHAGLPNHLQNFFKYSSKVHSYTTRSSFNADLTQNIGFKTKVGSLMLSFTGLFIMTVTLNTHF